MVMEIKQIEVIAYRDPVNNMPTCASDFRKNEICIFLKTRTFGCQEVCSITDEDVFRNKIRVSIGDGFLQPVSNCIVWNKGDTHGNN